MHWRSEAALDQVTELNKLRLFQAIRATYVSLGSRFSQMDGQMFEGFIDWSKKHFGTYECVRTSANQDPLPYLYGVLGPNIRIQPPPSHPHCLRTSPPPPLTLGPSSDKLPRAPVIELGGEARR